MLLQGSNSLRAAEPISNQGIKSRYSLLHQQINQNTNSKVRSHWFLTNAEKGKRLVKLSKSSLKKSKLLAKNIIENELSTLKGPDHLSLPTKPSDIRTEGQYPLKIIDLPELVEKNSPQLEVYRRQIEQEKYNLRNAISAWYPTIDLSASPQYLEGENYYDSGTDTSTDRWQTTLSIEINWDLIDPSRTPEIAAAKDKYEKSKTAYLIQLRDLKLEAENIYFLLQKSDEGVRIGKESMKASKISLRDAEARFEAGLGTRLEVLEAETQLARDRRLLTKKLGEQSINRSSLKSILNLPNKITPIAASSSQIIGIWDASLEESIISAYTFRQELENIRREISINNSNANIALAATQPKLSIFNTYSNSYREGKLASVKQDGSSTSNTVGLKATWRIFDGSKAISNYNYNKQMAKASEAKFADERNNIRQDIEKDFFQLKTANQDISSSTREVIAARESLRLARLRFKAGVTTQREVVNNQRDLTQAEVGYAEAITNYNQSITKLQRKTGIDYQIACKPPKIIPRLNRKTNVNNLDLESFPVIKPCQ